METEYMYLVCEKEYGTYEEAVQAIIDATADWVLDQCGDCPNISGGPDDDPDRCNDYDFLAQVWDAVLDRACCHAEAVRAYASADEIGVQPGEEVRHLSDNAISGVDVVDKQPDPDDGDATIYTLDDGSKVIVSDGDIIDIKHNDGVSLAAARVTALHTIDGENKWK